MKLRHVHEALTALSRPRFHAKSRQGSFWCKCGARCCKVHAHFRRLFRLTSPRLASPLTPSSSSSVVQTRFITWMSERTPVRYPSSWQLSDPPHGSQCVTLTPSGNAYDVPKFMIFRSTFSRAASSKTSSMVVRRKACRVKKEERTRADSSVRNFSKVACATRLSRCTKVARACAISSSPLRVDSVLPPASGRASRAPSTTVLAASIRTPRDAVVERPSSMSR
mmetsp:Transcript_4491/g.11855  ORF Transcript_4491/g.11855 Transcript_4491/m.11855 type:complete len:223 (-) Transcript_4491:27-695(-)